MAGEAYQIPTGSDILSYHGDPGLAAGTNPGGSLPWGNNDVTQGMSSALDKIQEVNAQKSLIDYKRKLQSQDDLAKMLSETGGSVFNMKGANGQNVSFSPLPDDQKVLTDKAHDLRKMILDNPDNYMFNQDYLDKKNEYSQLANHAGLRATAYNNYNLDAQKSDDPQERNQIKNWQKQEVTDHKLTEGYTPEPWLATIKSTDPIGKEWEDQKKWQEFGTKIDNRQDADGNPVDFEVKTIGKPNSLFTSIANGTDYVNLKNSTTNYNLWKQLPEARDPNAILQMDQKIKQYATARGIQPYYPATVDQQGNITYTQDPRIANAGLALEKHGDLQTEEKPSDASSKQVKEGVEINKAKADIRHVNAETKKLTEANGGKPPTAEELKEHLDQQAASSMYNEVQGVLNNGVKSAPVKANYPAYWEKNGIDPAKYNIYPALPKGIADKFIGISPTEKTEKITSGGTSITKKSSIPVVADKVSLIEDKESKEKKLVYWLDGKVKTIVPEKEAVVNGLKHEAGFNPKIYENKTAYVDQVSGGKAPGTLNGASQQASHSATRPVNIPVTAILKNGYYVDKANKKIYDPQTGEEVAIK